MTDDNQKTLVKHIGDSLSTTHVERKIGEIANYSETTAHIEKRLAQVVVEIAGKGGAAATNTQAKDVRKNNDRG